MSYPLLCLENPLLDIQTVDDGTLLKKYGLDANNAILAEEKHMGLYSELTAPGRDTKIIAGGAAQNTARGAAYMLPPNSVVYLGAVGADAQADQLRDACAKAGLRVEYHVEKDQPTGKCGVVITGHNRSLCTDLAAANCYKIEHLKSPEIWSLVEQAKYFYVGGYHLTVCVPAILALAEEAVAKDKVFALGMGAPFVAQFFKDQLAQTEEYWDYIMGNETEVRTWAESKGHSTKNVDEIARLMAELPKKNIKRKRVVIVTQGTEETVVAVQGESGLHKYPVHEISKEKIVDTNGAGDAFAGGFLSGLVAEKPLAECVERGQWLAALGIQQLGPQYPEPKQTFASKA